MVGVYPKEKNENAVKIIFKIFYPIPPKYPLSDMQTHTSISIFISLTGLFMTSLEHPPQNSRPKKTKQCK